MGDTSKKEEVGEDVAGSDLSSLAAMLKSSNLPQSVVNMMFQLIQNMENKEDNNQQPQAFRGQSSHRGPIVDSKVKTKEIRKQKKRNERRIEKRERRSKKKNRKREDKADLEKDDGK